MSALKFEVVRARAEPHAAVPTIVLTMRISDSSATAVHAIALRCQIRIEPQRRRYTPDEESRLYELFGDPPRWGDSLRPFPWTHVATTVSSFTGATDVDLPVECSYDFEVAAVKYLHGLDDGEIPLVPTLSPALNDDPDVARIKPQRLHRHRTRRPGRSGVARRR